MDDSIKCSNCGKNNSIDSNFCSGCGNKLVQNSTVAGEQNDIQQSTSNNDLVNNQTNSIDNLIGNILGILSLVLCLVIPLLLSFTSSSEVEEFFEVLTGLCIFSGINIMVIGRLKYPSSKFLKVVMWAIIVIGSIILGTMAFIIFVFLGFGLR